METEVTIEDGQVIETTTETKPLADYIKREQLSIEMLRKQIQSLTAQYEAKLAKLASLITE